MPSRSLRMFISALCLLAGIAGQARAEDPVLVNITGPLAARVGEKVAFEVELVNRSGRPLENSPANGTSASVARLMSGS